MIDRVVLPVIQDHVLRITAKYDMEWTNAKRAMFDSPLRTALEELRTKVIISDSLIYMP